MFACGAFLIGCTCGVLGREDLAKLWMGVSFAMLISYLEAMWKAGGGSFWTFFLNDNPYATYPVNQPKVFRPKTKKETASAIYKSAVETDKEEKDKKVKTITATTTTPAVEPFHLLNPRPEELPIIAKPITDIELGVIPPADTPPAPTPLQLTLTTPTTPAPTTDELFQDIPVELLNPK